MPTIYGTAGSGPGINPGHRPYVTWTVLSRTATQAVVKYTVGAQPLTGVTNGTFTGTLQVNNSKYPISGHVPSSGGIIQTLEVTYKQSSAFSLAISLTGSIPGSSGWTSTSLSGSGSVGAGGSAPGAPSNFRFERTGDTTATLMWDKGAGASTTYLTASRNSAAYYFLAETSGSSQNVVGLDVDSYWRFGAYSKSATGVSATVGPLFMYTKPKTPGKPTLGEGGRVTWASTAAYPHGFEVERSDGGTVVVEGRQAREWTDPNPQTIVSKYRVRAWAGTVDDERRAWSDWSEWSEAALDVVYKPPRISKFAADRCNSAGQLDPLGTYIRAVSSGQVFSVKEQGGPELNKRTVRFRRRRVGASSWMSWVNLVTNAAPAAWSNAGVTFGGGKVTVDDAYEAQMQVVDAFGQVQQQVTVPVAKTALSIGPAGIGVGKIIERGALDVGGDAHIDGDVYVAGHVSTVDPNIVIIGGQPYLRSGTFTTSSLTMSASGNIFTASIQSYLDALPAAPAGWVRVPSIARGAGNSTWVTNASGQWFVAGSTNVARAVTVAWQLFKDG